MDEEQFIEDLLARLASAKACDADSVGSLSALLESLEEIAAHIDVDPELLLEGIEDEVSVLLNDAQWLEDQIGPAATSCPELLRLVNGRLACFNQNLEVVLATNPHSPDDVLEQLMESDFAWEEYGTTQAIARNSSRPDFLQRLAASSEGSTRFEVAANVNTPPQILAKLAGDRGFSESLWYCGNGLMSFIQVAVARNPRTDQETLRGFARGDFMFSASDLEGAMGWELLNDIELGELHDLVKHTAIKRIEEDSY